MEQLQQVMGPEAAEVVETAVVNSQIEQSGIWPTVIGIAAIIVGATTVFAQMQQSLNRIWDVVPRPTRNSIWLFIKAASAVADDCAGHRLLCCWFRCC